MPYRAGSRARVGTIRGRALALAAVVPLAAAAAFAAAPAADPVEPVAAHAAGLVLVPKHLGYAASIHPFWSSQACTACHGASHPSLNLTGSAADVYDRVRQFPRVDTNDPAESLILTKPQPGTVAHGGGDFNCFSPGNNCYDTILHWISEGAPQNPCSYSLAPTSRSHGAGAGGGSVQVTAGAGCAWTAVANKTWIHVTGGSSGSGNGTVTYSIDANASTTARSGAITIAGLTFAISQAGAAACNYAIDPTSAAYPSGGGNGTVAVTVAAGCNWTAVANASWIHVNGGAAGSGNGTVAYSIDLNGAPTARSGTVTIAGLA